MATGLLNSSGTDFEQLFEQGGGNQLLNIYANDGQDIGQKFLNVSEGSQISSNTGFLAADGSDVKTKLCGKGLKKVNFTIKLTSGDWRSITATIAVSGVAAGSTVQVTGTAWYNWYYHASDRDDRDDSGKQSTAISSQVGNGTTTLLHYNGSTAGGRTSYSWSFYKEQTSTFNLTYAGRAYSIPYTATWSKQDGGKTYSYSGSF